jgi:hypothetical protein
MELPVVDLLRLLDSHARELSRGIENPQTLHTEGVKTHVARMYALAEAIHDAVAKQQAPAANGGEEAKAN